MDLVLYHYWRSSCSWRVRWALDHKGLSYTSIPVNLLESQQLAADYLRLNPMGQVPCLIVDGAALADSIAILEWLEEVAPRPALLPSAPADRAHVRRLVNIVAAGTQPLQNIGVLRRLSPDREVQADWSRHWITKGLSAFEEAARPRAGTFSFGDTPTMADLCLIPQLYNAQRFKLDLGQWPLLAAIQDRALALPSCERSAPQHQPGAEP